MKTNAQAAVWACFAADSLALGVHWVYDTGKIAERYGRVQSLLKPEIAAYHNTKDRGDFTHYGDQTLVLLESVVACGAFDAADFAARWKALFDHYSGYVDGATRATLANLGAGKAFQQAGSTSTDLGGAARVAPLLLCHGDDLPRLTTAARTQTALTHNTPVVTEGAVFFVRLAADVLRGKDLLEALQDALADASIDAGVRHLAAKGFASRDTQTLAAIAGFGQMCEAAAALPATVHLISRYPDSLEQALVENVMAGGDSAARGMLAAMILGARLGQKAIPAAWLADMKAETRIRALVGLNGT
jgi:ADP-ribosylglycohydrolase